MSGSTGDIVTPEKRSQMMAAIGQRDTPPEKAVRSILSSLGIHYRVKNRDLPGSPDIANRKRRWAIFVNGCFWHGHKNCPKTKGGPGAYRVPKTNEDFWREKLEANRARDARAITELRGRGFDVVVLWECGLDDVDAVLGRLRVIIGKSG